MVKSWKFVALQVLALLLTAVLALVAYTVTAQARAETAIASEYQFLRGTYAFCLSAYFDIDFCNATVASAVDFDVYHRPEFTTGYQPPVEQP